MSATASHGPSFSLAWRSHPRESSESLAVDRSAVLWVEVEWGLWVGRVDGEFTGMIEQTARGFEATDGRGATAGVHPSLVRAKRALAGGPGVGVRSAWRRVTGGSPRL
jgi:hypothetical protein